MKDLSLAEASFKKAIELAPNYSVSYIYLAELYRAQGRLGSAIKEYRGFAGKKSQAGFSAVYSWDDLRASEEGEKAKAKYQEALKVDPKFAPAANNLAYLMLEQGGDLNQALAFAQTAYESAPDDPGIADTLGWIYYNKKAYLKATELLKEAAEKLPENPVVQYHYGMVQFMNGDKEGAKKNLQAALKLSDKFPGAEEAKKTLTAL